MTAKDIKGYDYVIANEAVKEKPEIIDSVNGIDVDRIENGKWVQKVPHSATVVIAGKFRDDKLIEIELTLAEAIYWCSCKSWKEYFPEYKFQIIA